MLSEKDFKYLKDNISTYRDLFCITEGIKRNPENEKRLNNILYQIESTCVVPNYDLIRGQGKEAVIVATDLTKEAAENIRAELNELTEDGGYWIEEQ